MWDLGAKDLNGDVKSRQMRKDGQAVRLNRSVRLCLAGKEHIEPELE